MQIDRGFILVTDTDAATQVQVFDFNAAVA